MKNKLLRICIIALTAILSVGVFNACTQPPEPPAPSTPPTVTDIIIISTPIKSIYYLGEQQADIDLTGGMIQKQYSDGTFSPLLPMDISGHVIENFDTSAQSDAMSLTYKYLGFNKAFSIKVSDFTLSVVQGPSKAWYFEDMDESDVELDGLQLKAVPTKDNTIEDIFAFGQRTINFERITKTTDEATIYVSYLGKEVSFTVELREIEE